MATDGYTEIEYGNGASAVQIVNCTTLKFHQENILDASGIDVKFQRYTVRVSGYMLAQTVANTQIIPNGAGIDGGYTQTAANQHIGLRKVMLTPQQPFKMTMGVGGANPTIILQANPVTSATEDIDETFDVQGGPQPKDLSIIHVVGNTSLKVEFEIVVCLSPDCGEDSDSGDVQRARGILSNKWTCADDIDENFYLRSRTFVGELKLANPLVNPHDYRQLVVPAISPGMRPKSMQFKCSEDCLTLQYTVVHEEVTITAPAPATSIRISHKVHIEAEEINVAETLSITLKGDRHVDKQELIDLILQIADGKIRMKRLVQGAGFKRVTFLKSQEIVDESGTNQDNQIHGIFHLYHVDPKNLRVPGDNADLFTKIRRGIGIHIDDLVIPDYDNTLTRGNRAGETPEFKGPITVVGAFASHLQSKCTMDHSVNAALEGSEEVDTALIASMSPEMELPSVTLDIYPGLDDLPDETFSSAHTTDGMYQTYQIDSQYSEMPMVAQLPVSVSSFYGEATPSSADYAIADGDTSAFVRIGPSQWKRTVRILAQRHASPPRLPEPLPSFRDEDGVLNVLMGREFALDEPQRTAAGDGLRSYVARAEYVYGMSRAPTKIRAGIPDHDAAEDPYADPETSPSLYAFTMASLFSSNHAIG